MMDHDNGWPRAEEYVRAELERLSTDVRTLTATVTEFRVETVAELKVLKSKAGLYGLVGSAIVTPILVALLLKVLR